ncbi:MULTISPECIES: helix-turn-helix domain-containing protein [unclassified Eubacterium (in: firmicutes)]|jgi:IS30 family transposase|uniref:helix-turn-helix domain-containing protein n=1 Tax=Eubacterium TaxID=1730 RepID=UPI000E48086D|nr:MULTISPECIES: helix-turn-helix domain-containing protein [unclassified Eubacterium (in: firmicutes)]RGF49939.1 helix-turn-helix domain-containing protein [Eubacterium sp. AF36-5BH]RHP21165.1 helix-turn-helix domain-containing protein [Eubacterium sp. AF34-35BH]
MSNLIPGNQKHLTLDDCEFIEDSLNEDLSFKEIAKYLCKDPTTISKASRLHQVNGIQPNRIFNNLHNICTDIFRCKHTKVCQKIILCAIKCSSCNKI